MHAYFYGECYNDDDDDDDDDIQCLYDNMMDDMQYTYRRMRSIVCRM